MLYVSQAKSKAKAKAREIVIIADRLDTSRENVHTHNRTKAKARGSNESAIIAVRRAIPRGNAPRAKKEERQKGKETTTKEKVKERGAGAQEFGK